MKQCVRKVIDWFYFPFIRKWIPLELFRYGFCGATTVLLDWVLFWLCYNFVFNQQNWDAGFFVFSPYTLSKLISAPTAALVGFWLQKNITFQNSSLRSITQFARYLMVFAINLAINIVLGKEFLVEQFGLWATPANMAVTVITIIFSFLMQKYFTFWRPKKNANG